MNNLALKKKMPWGCQVSLVALDYIVLKCVFSLDVYYHKYGIILQMSIWRLWQASVLFYSQVLVFLFIFVAFCD